MKEALVSRKVTSHAAAAEAYYTFNNRELFDLPLTKIFTKLRRWMIKMEDEATTTEQRRDKHLMGHVRFQLTPDLKLFVDISKSKTAAEF